MRTYLRTLITLALLCTCMAYARQFTNEFETLTTTDGITYAKVRIERQEGNALVIFHSAGIARIPISTLPTNVPALLALSPMSNPLPSAQHQSDHTQSSYQRSSGKAALTIDRAWSEDVGGYRCAYVLVTWRNTTKETFQSVTIQATAYDPSGTKIDIGERSFFAFERGPIRPGFEGTLKIPVELGNATFHTAECSVVSAQ